MRILGDFSWSYDRLSNLYLQLGPLPPDLDPHIQQPNLVSALCRPVRRPKHRTSTLSSGFLLLKPALPALNCYLYTTQI